MRSESRLLRLIFEFSESSNSSSLKVYLILVATFSDIMACQFRGPVFTSLSIWRCILEITFFDSRILKLAASVIFNYRRKKNVWCYSTTSCCN